MNEANITHQCPPEKPSKSIGGLIAGIVCMIIDVWLGNFVKSYFSPNHFGTLFFVGLGFIIYYFK